jgi:iron complex outermembrane recepter protein
MNQLGCSQRRWKENAAAYSRALGLATLLVCAAAPVVAEQSSEHDQAPANAAPPPKSEASNEIQEILVTARRRAEQLSDVPETVAAISADSLIKQGIRTEADLQAAVPGLIVRSALTSNLVNYVIRGESVDAYSGSPPGVQSYINEVPISADTATAFYDLGNVQVVKGPQGTLFGRNSTGGAVMFQTQQPKNDLDGYLSVQYGNFGRVVTEGAINLPLVSDKVLVRLAGIDTSGGAFVRNLFDGQELGNQDEQSGRITVEIRPNDQFTNMTTVQYTRIGGTNTPIMAYYAVPCGQQGGFDSCNLSPSVPAFNKLISGKSGVLPGYPGGYVFPGGLAALPAYLRSVGPYVVDLDSQYAHKAHSESAVNTSTLELSPSVSVKNIFGYSYSSDAFQYDADSSPYPTTTSAFGSPPYETDNEVQYSDELQLQGKSFEDRLTYMVGFFFFKSDDNYYSPIGGVSIVPPDTLSKFSIAYHALTRDESYALFGQATYKITDELNLTLGARGTKEDLSVSQLADSVFGAGNPQSTTETKPSWTASLDDHLSHDLMVYLATRGSWRRGGYNPFASPGSGPTVTAAGGGNYFLPETVRDVELGAKFDGRIAGMPFQANVDVYHSWITDLQKTAYVIIDGNAASAAVNVPRAELTGVEGDMNVRPTEWLRLGGTFSYNDGKFTQPRAELFGLSAVFGPFGDTPRYSGSLYGEATANLPGDAGSLTYRTDLYAQSSFFFSNLDATLTPGTQLPGYGLVNMRLDWAHTFGSKLTVSLFVKNLADKTYFTGGNAGAQNDSIEAAAWGMPRTYGVGLRYDF